MRFVASTHSASIRVFPHARGSVSEAFCPISTVSIGALAIRLSGVWIAFASALISFAVALCCSAPCAYADEFDLLVPAADGQEGSGVDDGQGGGSPTILPEGDEEDTTQIVGVLYSDGNLLIRLAQDGDDDLVGTTVPAIGAGNSVGGSGAGEGGAEGAETGNSSGENGSNSGSQDSTNELSGHNQNAPHSGSSNNADGEGGVANPSGSTDGSNLVKVMQLYKVGNGAVAENEYAPWHERAEEITHIFFGQRIRPVSMANWFKGLVNLVNVDFGGLDTSRVADMQSLFSDCKSLAAVNVSQFDTSGVTNMERMFAGCQQVAALDLSSFDTSLVTSMNSMFSGLASMQTVNLKSFDTDNVIDMTSMFAGCSSVKSLNLSSFRTPKLESLGGMFEGCTSLSALDVSGFTAEQLAQAAIPVDNEGGFWRMNVPEGYDPGVELRQPTEEERKAAIDQGENINPAVDPDNPNPDDPDSPDNPDKPDPIVDPNKNTNPRPDVDIYQQSSVSEYGSTAPGSYTFGSASANATEQAPALDLSVLSSALFAGLAGVGSDLVVLILSSTAVSGADPSGVTTAATDVISAADSGRSFDRTMAIATAIVGMIIAAGLLLTFVFKLR